MVQARSNVYVNVNVPGSDRVQGDTVEKPQRRHSLFRAKVLMFLLLVGLLSYKFPIAALYITTKLFGAVSATTSAAGNVAIKAADTAIKVAEQAKNAAEAEMARRLIVKDALAALTPCSMLRCNSEMENIVGLLSSLKEAHHKATVQGVTEACSPIEPSDEKGRYLLATAAPWLIQQGLGSLPRAACTTTISSNGDTEETCKFETDLLPCRNAVKWPNLAFVLEEPFKIFNQKLINSASKQKERLMRMLSAPDQVDAQSSFASRGDLSILVEEVLGDNFFIPAAPRRSTVRVTPYSEESQPVLKKMEVLREDQKIKPQERFCKKDGYADSAAGFCATSAKLTKEKLRKAIEVVGEHQRTDKARAVRLGL